MLMLVPNLLLLHQMFQIHKQGKSGFGCVYSISCTLFHEFLGLRSDLTKSMSRLLGHVEKQTCDIYYNDFTNFLT